MRVERLEVVRHRLLRFRRLRLRSADNGGSRSELGPTSKKEEKLWSDLFFFRKFTRLSSSLNKYFYSSYAVAEIYDPYNNSACSLCTLYCLAGLLFLPIGIAIYTDNKVPTENGNIFRKVKKQLKRRLTKRCGGREAFLCL